MAIKKYYVNSPKPGYLFDRESKKYYSWGFDIWIDRQRVEKRGYASRKEAEEVVVEMKRRERNGSLGIVTADIPYLIELFQKKLNSMEGPDRARAKRIYTYFLDLLPKHIRVPDLRTAHLQLFVEARQNDVYGPTDKKITNETVRRELVPIVAALNSAYKYFPELDDYQAPRIPRPRIAKGKKERVISPAEQEALFKYFFAQRGQKEAVKAYNERRRTGQFLHFCLLSLSRPGEIAALKMADIDLEQGVVIIRGTKTRFKTEAGMRQVPIGSTMRQIIDERLLLSNGDFLFTKKGLVTWAMYNEMKNACEAIGVKYGRTDKDAISFHTARHTGITMLLQSGVDLKTVGRMAGHSDSRMTLYYTHSNPELVQRAGAILEEKMGSSNKIHCTEEWAM